MFIQEMGAGQCADVSVDGTVVVIGDLEIDCAARQTDSQQIVDVRSVGAQLVEGGGEALVASVVIPPKRFVETGEGEEAELVAVPLDGDDVVLRLWPYAA